MVSNVTNSRFDNDEYTPEGGSVDVATRGSKNQNTAVNAGIEDRESAQSEATGRIPKRTSAWLFV
jgi:hypothetical protein